MKQNDKQGSGTFFDWLKRADVRRVAPDGRIRPVTNPQALKALAEEFAYAQKLMEKNGKKF